MKIYLVVASCVAWMTLVQANEICIQDVKVITPQGLYEEIKKQETDNGHLVSTQTIEIKKPNINKIKEKSEKQIKAEQQLEARKHLINKFLKHLRLTKMLHSLLSSMEDIEPAHFDQPKPKPVHHNHHRVIIIRMLPSNPFSLPPLFPGFSPFNTTDNKYSSSRRIQVPADKIESSADNIESPADQSVRPVYSITTPSPPLQDQIPPPEVISNEIPQ